MHLHLLIERRVAACHHHILYHNLPILKILPFLFPFYFFHSPFLVLFFIHRTQYFYAAGSYSSLSQLLEVLVHAEPPKKMSLTI